MTAIAGLRNSRRSSPYLSAFFLRAEPPSPAAPQLRGLPLRQSSAPARRCRRAAAVSPAATFTPERPAVRQDTDAEVRAPSGLLRPAALHHHGAPPLESRTAALLLVVSELRMCPSHPLFPAQLELQRVGGRAHWLSMASPQAALARNHPGGFKSRFRDDEPRKGSDVLVRK